MKTILLAILLAFSFLTVTMAAPAKGAKSTIVKKQEKKEAPVTYKKPTRKKVVHK